MSPFAYTRDALEGFRILRRHPGAVALWVASYLAIEIALGLLIIFTNGRERLASVSVKFAGLFSAPERIWDFIVHFGLSTAALLLLGLMFTLTFCMAIYRAVLTPDDQRFGYIRFGADELRLTVVSLLTPLLVPTVPVAIAAAAASRAFRGEGVVALIGFAASLAVSAISIWVSVRLMLVGPMTLDRGEHSIEDSWRLSRGHFWPLLWITILSVLLGIGVQIFSTIVGVIVAAIALGSEKGSLAAIILAIVGLLLVPFFSTLTLLVMASPAAAAYRRIRTEPEAGAALA